MFKNKHISTFLGIVEVEEMVPLFVSEGSTSNWFAAGPDAMAGHGARLSDIAETTLRTEGSGEPLRLRAKTSRD